VIGALSDEFFAGEGARPATRTLFAVGDEKQSIYSFQGARPERFAQEREAGLPSSRGRRMRSSNRSRCGFRSALPPKCSSWSIMSSPKPMHCAAWAPPDEPVIHETARAQAPGPGRALADDRQGTEIR
jgi:ATP-dependent helicase/nuclease subunit A